MCIVSIGGKQLYSCAFFKFVDSILTVKVPWYAATIQIQMLGYVQGSWKCQNILILSSCRLLLGVSVWPTL